VWYLAGCCAVRSEQPAVTHALANDVGVGIIVFIVGLLESQAFEHRPTKAV
jgi:hypothetical protein